MSITNYIQFSESILDLVQDEIEWIRKELTGPKDKERKEWGKERDIRGDDLNYWPDFDWKIIDSEELWFYTMGEGNIRNAINFIQRFLIEFRPKDTFTLTWAESCNRPIIKEFGGGAVIITAKGYKTITTLEWISQQIEKN